MKIDQAITLSGAAAAGTGVAPESPRSEFAEEPKVDLARSDSREGFQDGVLQAEAMTQSWTKSSLVTMFGFFWLTYAAIAFSNSIVWNLGAYVTSEFSEHSLIPTIGIVSNIMSAVAYMVLAKVLNLWHRSYGYLAMTALATLGLILSAACKDIYTYCAAQVFMSIGFIGIIFSIDVQTADTSHLRNRGLAFAFTASPYIITAYAGPKISEKFYENNWRWGFGAFAIIIPFVGIPMFIFLQIQKRRAVSTGFTAKAKSGRTFAQSVVHYLIEFDVLGIFLISAGLVLFLLPFNLAASAAETWKSAHIIAMLVVGVVCLIAFGLVERFVSPKPFIPFHLLANRTVLGACVLGFSWQIAYYAWASYFGSYLQVVFDLSISTSGYITSIYDVVASVWMFPVGYAIRKTGYFKWILLIGVPVYALGEGLMIHFRKPGNSLGWLIFTQVLIALAGSSFTCIQQVAVLSAGSHNDAAAMLALLGLFGYFGGAVGNSVSGAIWTNTLPEYLQRFLPEEALPEWETIYGDLTVQLSYPIGDPVREAIMLAYAEAQSRMLIAGTSIMALAAVCVLIIRNIKVSEIEQVKGVVF